MIVQISSSSSTDVSKSMRQYVENSVSSLEPLLNKDAHVRCTIRVSKHEKRFKIIVNDKRYTLRAESINQDFYEAVDSCVNKIKKSCHKLKDKLNDKRYKFVLPDEHKTQHKSVANPIAKEKIVDAVAMSTESAILQMEALDYDFFLFLNSETLEPSLVYYRRDGSIGLIRCCQPGSE